MNRARIGVVGCGFMGRLHAATLAQATGGELTAVFDADPAAAVRTAEAHGARACTSLDELLAMDLDGVVVATPDHAHRDSVVRAAQAGLGVLVEKPLATRLDDADAMIAATYAAGVPLLVGHILRFETAYANLREAVRAGVLGDLVSVYARRHGLRGEADRFAGGTHVVDYLGVHDFDVLNWLRPARPVRVQAHQARGDVFDAYGTPDVVFSSLTFGDGSLAVVESGWTLPNAWGETRAPEAWGPFGDVRLDVFGRKGTASLDLRTMNLVAVDAQGWRMPETRHWPRLDGRVAGALREESDHFVRCLTTGETPRSSGRTARDAVAICRAVHRSLDQGGAVEVTDLEHR